MGVKRKTKTQPVEQPAVFFSVRLDENAALPAAFPSACPKCGVSFEKGFNLLEVAIAFHNTLVNRSQPVGLDDRTSKDAYSCEEYVFGWECAECETHIAGSRLEDL